jgi:hypothetical protein
MWNVMMGTRNTKRREISTSIDTPTANRGMPILFAKQHFYFTLALEENLPAAGKSKSPRINGEKCSLTKRL